MIMKKITLILIIFLFFNICLYAADDNFIGIIAEIKNIIITDNWFSGRSTFVVLKLTNGQEIAGYIVGTIKIGGRVYLINGLSEDFLKVY